LGEAGAKRIHQAIKRVLLWPVSPEKIYRIKRDTNPF
jgi:hypothetical protein